MSNARDFPNPVHEVIGVTLRAPRVAVVFEGGDDWLFWAREAMREVTTVWAGAGFVLVPHHAGHVTAVVKEWVQSYDPDFIVVATQTWAQRENLRPGNLAASLTAPVDADALVALTNSTQPAAQYDAENARSELALVCTPYARWDGEGWDEDRQDLTGSDSGQLRLQSSIGDPPGVCLAVPGSWGGSVATAAAACVGVLEPASPGAVGTDDDAAVLAFLLDVPHSPPPNTLVHRPTGIAMSVQVAAQPTALESTLHGLTWAWRAGTRQRQHLVVGSSADDFAVAMMMNRIHHDTSWVDPAWAAAGVLAPVLTTALNAGVGPRGAGPVVTSVTLDASAVSDWQRSLSSAPERAVADVRPYRSRGTEVVRGRRRVHHLSVQGQHDRRHSIPLVRRSDGTVDLAATPPMPTVEPGHPIDTSRVPVQVDLAIPGTAMPTCRGVDAHAFAGSEDEQFHTWVRSSRAGVSYESFRYDFVSSGASAYGRLATPRLTVPGLHPWVQQMARQAGYGVRLSDAGRRVEVLARLWDGREPMAAAIASPLRNVLERFTPPRQGRDSYLDGDGIRITSDRGVLSFTGIRSHWDEPVDDLTVRCLVDDLTQRRILRRGLLLRCPDCLRVDFHPVDHLAQHVTCDQCSAQVSLTQANWGKPETEPTWFYDAHPLARQLTTSNSDVPLLLAAHLSQGASNHSHIGEVELIDRGKSVAETDLIALTDDTISVAEVKTNTDLAASGKLTRAVAKRVLVAQVVRADQIILATTQQQWPQATIDALQGGIDKANWFGRPPTIRLITRLRTANVGDCTM